MDRIWFAERAHQQGRAIGSLWEQWVEAVLEVIARQPPVGTPDGPFQRDLTEAISQPLPTQLR